MVHLIFFLFVSVFFLCIFWRQKTSRFRRLCSCGVHARCECVRSLIARAFLCMCVSWVIGNSSLCGLFNLFFFVSLFLSQNVLRCGEL